MEKYLVCEKCMKQFDLQERIPIVMFCCGMTYCKRCILEKTLFKCSNCLKLGNNKIQVENLIVKKQIEDNQKRLDEKHKMQEIEKNDFELVEKKVRKAVVTHTI